MLGHVDDSERRITFRQQIARGSARRLSDRTSYRDVYKITAVAVGSKGSRGSRGSKGLVLLGSWCRFSSGTPASLASFCELLADEQHLRAGVTDDRRDLRGRVVRVERNGDGAALQDAEIGRAPMRVVGGEDGAAIAGANALLRPATMPTPTPCRAAGDT